MNSLDNRLVIWVDVRYWSSDAIFDTSIWNDNRWRWIWRSFSNSVVEVSDMILSFLRMIVKEKLIWKKLMSLFLGKNSWLKEENKRIYSLQLLSMSISGLRSLSFCLAVRLSRYSLCRSYLLESTDIKIDLIMWLGRRENPCKWNLWYSFLR